jgi:hypothetical protein
LIQKDRSDDSEGEKNQKTKEAPAFEIDSDDDEEDDMPDTRDIVRRMTLMKGQFDKFNIPDDFDFGEMYKSIVIRNVSKFDLSESMQ